MSYDNLLHAHRHALHALEDFRALARALERGPTIELYASLLHSISHHLRHAAYRTGQELSHHDRREVVLPTFPAHQKVGQGWWPR